MDGLRKSFSYMFSSSLERTVIDLLDDNLNNFINEQACEQFALILEGRSDKYTRQDALLSLLRNARKAVTWSAALKALMIIHKLTHMEGDILAEFLISNKLDNISDFKVQNAPLKAYVQTATVPHYYKYLQKLSYNYNDLSVCFFADDDFSNRLKENDLSLLHFISKVQNTLGYLSEMLPFLEVSILQIGKTNLMRQIAYYCLTDCYHYYTYISQAVSFVIKEIFNLKKSDALFLYEIYCEHVRMTKKLKDHFQLRNHLKEFFLKIPDFYRIDLDQNQQIEHYINALKTGKAVPEIVSNVVKPSAKNNTYVNPFLAPVMSTLEMERKNSKGKFTENLEIDVDEEKDTVKRDEEEETAAPASLHDISKVMLQITTPNFKSMQKKELFKAPMVNRKLTAMSSPKLVVISPTGEIAQGQNALDKGSKGNGLKYSDMNPFMSQRVPNRKQSYEKYVQSDRRNEPIDEVREYQQVEKDSPSPGLSANVSMSDSYIIGRKNSG